jgi:diacylglycerol kinase (ATP)
MSRPIAFTGRIRSFRYAFRGLATMIASQHNAWIHTLATALVLAAALAFRITREEWVWTILAIVAVWVAESLNTAFEFLCDVAQPDFHPLVAKAKDVAAGAVLIAALGAVAIGVIVFAPHAAALLQH